MAGINLTPQRRSQLLEMLLRQQAQPQNPQTGIEAALRLGGDLIRQRTANRLQMEEQQEQAASQSRLAEALQSGQARPPSKFEFEPIMGAEQTTPSPMVFGGTNADPQRTLSAISKLPNSSERIAALQELAMRKSMRGEPLTELGKLGRDVAEGWISPEAAAMAKADEVGGLSVTDRAKLEDQLREEYYKRTGGQDAVMTGVAQVKSLIEEGNPFAVQAALTAFIRSIDDSVVRPSEMAAYQNIMGVMQGLVNRYSELSGGGPLAEKGKAELIRAANALEREARRQRSANEKYYTGLAKRRKLDPVNVLGTNSPPKKTNAKKPEDTAPATDEDDTDDVEEI